MRILAHVVENESSFTDRLLHPLTGFDHLVALALAAVSIVLLTLAIRGRHAATTAGTTVRVRTVGLITAAAVLLASSVALLLIV